MLFLRVCGYCIKLTKMKAMSLWLFYLFEKMLSMQFFWNIRQIILELFRNSKYPIRYLLWWHKILPGAIWTQTYSEPLQASKIECFADTVNGWKNKAGVRCAKQISLTLLRKMQYFYIICLYYIFCVLYVLKYLNGSS